MILGLSRGIVQYFPHFRIHKKIVSEETVQGDTVVDKPRFWYLLEILAQKHNGVISLRSSLQNRIERSLLAMSLVKIFRMKVMFLKQHC